MLRVTKACLTVTTMADTVEDSLVSPMARVCCTCGYSLYGLPEPARCPECGALELPTQVVEKGFRAAGFWRVAFMGPFVDRRAGQALWDVCIHPALGRTCRLRAIVLPIAFVLFILAAVMLCNWWVFKLPSTPGGSTVYRCWWYDATISSVPTTRPGRQIRYGQTPGGEQIAYFYQFGNSAFQIPAIVYEIIRKHVFQGVKTLYLGWGFLVLVWPILAAFILRVELKQAYRMSGLLLASFVPFLLLVPVVLLANLAYAFFWLDFPVVRWLVWVHVFLALWPAFMYARYSTLTRANRLAGLGLAVLTCLLVPFLALYSGIVLYIGQYALNWV